MAAFVGRSAEGGKDKGDSFRPITRAVLAWLEAGTKTCPLGVVSSWAGCRGHGADVCRPFPLFRTSAGMYKNGHFKFTFNINQNYPHEPPKVKCTQKVRPLQASASAVAPHADAPRQIYHPNIDLEGAVCLNLVRRTRAAALSLASRTLTPPASSTFGP
jgi:hypothetical protein